MNQQLRQRIHQSAKECCEYCLFPQSETAISHQIDHVRAKQHGGTDDEDNLCLCCAVCNRYKGPNLSSIDPETQEVTQLFNPRKHLWTQHFRLDNERIVGLTPEARATAFLLQFNTAERLLERKMLVVLRYFQNL